MAITEIQTNLDEYNGSCSNETAESALTNELYSSAEPRLAEIDKKIEELTRDDPKFLEEKSKLIAERIEIKTRQTQTRSLLHQKQPVIGKLYNLQSASRNGLKEGEKVDAQIKFDQQGNPFLKINQQMDGAVGFDFSITGDGKVVFGAMDDSKMAEAIDFLYRRGITNFELPAGAPKTPEEVKQRQEDQQKLDNTVANVKQNAPSLEDNPRYISKDENHAATTQTQNTVNFSNPEGLQTSSAEAQAGASSSKSFKECRDELKDWATNSLKKEEGYGLHISGDTFSFYKDNSKNWYKEDGRIEEGKNGKSDVRNDHVECRVKLHKKDDKLTGVSYYVADNGALNGKYVGEILKLAKMSGNVLVEFPKGIPASDVSEWRTQCAKKGLIPTGPGVPVGVVEAKEMIDNAGKAMDKSSAAFKKYQNQMGRYLEQEALKKDPVDTEKLAYAKELQKEKKFEKLKDVYEPILKTIEVSSKNDNCEAKNIIGSANAATTLFQLFDKYGSQTVEQLAQNQEIDESTRKALSGLTGGTNIPIEDMSPEGLKIMYHALKREKTIDAQRTLDENLLNNKNDKSASRLVNNAKNNIRDIIIEPLNHKGLTGLSCDINTDKPKHTLTHSNTNNASQQQPTPNRRNSGMSY